MQPNPIHTRTIASSPPPSRRGNPFATCWTRPGALAFRFAEGLGAEQLVARLAAQNWWGEIVGPHGSGKSTLLETLRLALVAAGCRVHAIALRDGQRRLPTDLGTMLEAPAELGEGEAPAELGEGEAPAELGKGEAPAEPRACVARGSAEASPSRALVIVDGYEQLGWLGRLQLKRHCRRTGASLLVTCHAPTGLPTLIRLSPDRRLIEQLVADLCAEVSTKIATADVAASHACHGSNVRDIFFDLYDRHEMLRRAR